MTAERPKTISAQTVYEGAAPDTALPALVRLNAYTRLVALQTGIRILYWDARTEHDFSYSVRHDDDLIYFGAYTGGKAHLEARCRDGLTHYETDGGLHDAYIAYRPGCRIDFTKTAGVGAGVTIALSPSVLADLSAEDAACLDQKLRSGHYFNQVRGGRQLLAFANGLRAVGSTGSTGSTGEGERPGSQLQMLGQSLSFMGLLLEQMFQGEASDTSLSRQDIRRLNNIRDMLLADLAAPPRLDKLARQAGMSVSRLQRSFRMLFGTSVYAFFQKERMQEAHRLLLSDEESILGIALRMGYSNPGHFTAAFRKQFGLNPSDLRQSSRLRR